MQENNEHEFTWGNHGYYLFGGHHFFRFEPSKTTPGGTTFTQGEDFTGLFSFAAGLPGMEAKARPGLEAFNNDLKRRAESSL